MYQINNLSFAYEKGDQVFNNLSLSLPKGKIVVIKGGNGSGKTTLCTLLTGLITNYQGSILYNGQELSCFKTIELSKDVLSIRQDAFGNSIGIDINEDLQIWQNRLQEADDQEKIYARDAALKSLNITEIASQPIWRLSGGQRKAGMLAALSLYPQKYWMLDEPVNNLDSEKVGDLLNILKDKKDSLHNDFAKHNFHGVLITTHKPELFSSIADIFYSLDDE